MSAPETRTGHPWWWLGLLLLTMLAFEIRYGLMDRQSFWYDEVISTELIEASYSDLFFGRARDNGNPPLYWVALKATSSVFGETPQGYRLFSVLCGTLCVVLIGGFGRAIVGERAGLVAAGLLTISPFALELSADTRSYAFLWALVLGNGWYFFRWMRDRSLTDLLGYLVTMALACLTHYFALLLPVVHLAALLAMPRGSRPVSAWFCGMLGVAGVATVWWPAFWEQITQSGNLSRMSESWTTQFLATPLAFAFGRSLVWRADPMWLLGLVNLLACVLFGILAIQGVLELWQKDNASIAESGTASPHLFRARAVLLAGWVVVPILIPFMFALLGHPIYNVRYPSFAVPALLILVGYGVGSLTLAPRIAWTAGVVGLSVLSLVRYQSEPLMDDWRTAAPVLLGRTGAEVPILIDSDVQARSLRFQANLADDDDLTMPDQVFALDHIDAETGELAAVRYHRGVQADDHFVDYSGNVVEADRFWLVFCVPNDDPEEYANYFAERGYTLDEEHHFHRIDAYLLSRNGLASRVPQRILFKDHSGTRTTDSWRLPRLSLFSQSRAEVTPR